MYESHFGLHRQPFQCAELSRAFYVSESIRAVLPQLMHALRSDLGIAVLTGPPGVGKSSLLRHLQSLLSTDGRSIICSGASLETPTDVLLTLQTASQLKTGEKAPAALADRQAPPTRWSVVEQMRKTTEFWGPILLLIDDAQLLPVNVLNELKALTEEEWNGRGLVRILISGPLSFEEELARPTHVDFSRRIRCHAFLQPLTTQESVEFLNRHLEAAGGRLRNVFTAEALELISAACDGLPRCLSLLADESLVVAAETSLRLADESCVRRALSRLQHLPYSWNASPLRSEENLSTEADHVHSIDSTPANVRGPDTKSVAGVIEFGAAGVIEIGARNSVSSMSSLIADSAATRSTDSDKPSVVFAVANDAAESIDDSDWETAFEVGHRFSVSTSGQEAISHSTDDIADLVAESRDFTLYQNAEPAVISDDAPMGESPGETSPAGYLVDSAADARPVVASDDLDRSESRATETKIHLSAASPVENDPACELDSDVAVHFLTATRRISGMSFRSQQNTVTGTAVAFQSSAENCSFRQIAEEHFSDPLPVFDRYTWIALGRDVPTGSLTSSSVSQPLYSERQAACSDSGLAGEIASAPALAAFDKIEVTRTSDREILASLCGGAAGAEFGTFFPIHPDQQAARLAVAFDSGDREEASSSDLRKDREAREAIRFSIYRETSSDDPVFDDRSASAKRASDVADSIERSSESSWHDGQLIFGSAGPKPEIVSRVSAPSMPVASVPALPDTAIQRMAVPETAVPEKAESESAVPDTAVAETAVSAAETQQDSDHAGTASESGVKLGQSERETVSGVPHREKFYTLPVELTSAAWDLRMELGDFDEVFPLAESLVAFRSEVTSFQKFGKHTSSGNSDVGGRTAETVSSTRPTTSNDSLVARAKSRLDEMSASQSFGSTDSEAMTLPVSQDEHPVVPAAIGEFTSDAGESTSPSRKYGQLFTRLREMKRGSCGNDR